MYGDGRRIYQQQSPKDQKVQRPKGEGGKTYIVSFCGGFNLGFTLRKHEMSGVDNEDSILLVVEFDGSKQHESTIHSPGRYCYIDMLRVLHIYHDSLISRL